MIIAKSTRGEHHGHDFGVGGRARYVLVRDASNRGRGRRHRAIHGISAAIGDHSASHAFGAWTWLTCCEFITQGMPGGTVVIHCGDELLLLHAHIDRITRNSAFRIFVSGLADSSTRRHIVRVALSGGGCTAGCAAARNSPVTYDSNLSEIVDPDVPVAVTRDQDGFTRIGRLGDQVGRLSPVLDVVVDRNDPFECGLVLATATVAVANLKVDTVEALLVWAAAPAEDMAVAKAVSEGFERWAIGDIRPAPAKCAANRLDAPIIDPDDLVKYSNGYYIDHADTHRTYEAGQERHWVAVSRAGGERRYVLAEFIFNPFWGSGDDRRVHTFSSSSGVASHPHIEPAARCAARELIERDAIMAWWTGAVDAVEIDRSSEILNQQLHSAPGVRTRKGLLHE